MLAISALSNVIERGAKVANKTLNNLMGEPKKSIPLSVKQQVDRFLNMSDVDLNAIKQQRGEYEYLRYTKIMIERSKEIYG